MNLPKKQLLTFSITSNKPFSREFVKRDINSFSEAAEYIQQLPFKRNKNKNDLLTVFSDNCGTCGTKHAVLKMLANENGFEDVKLLLGIFEMSASTTPAVAKTLNQYGLDYIPEAHNYLKYKDTIYDYTKPGMKLEDFKDVLMKETELHPEQIADYKVTLHKEFINDWLSQNPHIRYTPDAIWAIREQCIADLSV